MKFKRNVGGIDRAARFGFGLVFLVLSATGVLPATVPMAIGYIIGIVLLTTGIFSYCPANDLIGFNSRKASGFGTEGPEKTEEKKEKAA
jgi:DUF2892 family protein